MWVVDVVSSLGYILPMDRLLQLVINKVLGSSNINWELVEQNEHN